jgi:hypothetical protein
LDGKGKTDERTSCREIMRLAAVLRGKNEFKIKILAFSWFLLSRFGSVCPNGQVSAGLEAVHDL